MNKTRLGYLLFLCCLIPSFKAGQTTSQDAPTLPADAPQVQQEIKQIESLIGKLPDRGAALFLLAHDYAHLGQRDKTLSLVKDCIALEEGFDPEGDAAFDLLKDNSEFREFVEHVHRRYPAVQRAHLAFTIPERDLVPEGLAVNSSTGTLYMSSLHLGKIVQIAKTGATSDLVAAGKYSFGPICGLKVDPSDSSLWSAICPDSGSGAELVHFDRSGNLIGRFPASTPGQHLFNDLVLRGTQEIYLTDSLANRAYLFDRRTHTFAGISLSRAIYYPNGIALSDDGNLLYVADAFGIVVLDLGNNKSQELEPGPKNTVSGADGLYWYKNTLIAVQNSLGSSRIAQFRLSRDGRKVTGTRILESRSTAVTLPTTGAIDGTKFYFMSNTQVDNFKDGKIVDPRKLEAVRIAVIELSQ